MSEFLVSRPLYRAARRFFKSPKGLLLLVLAAFTACVTLALPASDLLPGLLLATVAAVSTDLLLVWRKQRVVVPDGALLTGLITALLLRPQEPWYVFVAAPVVAIAAKHLLRTRWSNVFNPAALAIVAASLLFGSGQSWWGALPDLGAFGVAALLIAGIFVAGRINKLPMVLAFIGAYFTLFTIAGFFGHAARTAEVFVAPDLHAVLFFAFFMLDDPPTSPVRYEDQVVFGLAVATLAYFLFMTQGPVYYLSAALLAGNLWESGRRLWLNGRSRRPGPRAAAGALQPPQPAPRPGGPAPGSILRDLAGR